MAITTGEFERTLYPALKVVIKDAEEKLAPEYTALFNVADTDRAYDEEWSWGGLGGPVAKTEGTGVSFSKIVPGYYKRYNQATFGLGFIVTLEMRTFEKYGIIGQLASDLGDSIREGIEVLASGVLNTSLTDAGPDGEYLFSTAHPILRGGTQSNRLSTLADVSFTSYAQMLTMAETVVSNEGRKRRMTPSMLWHTPQLEVKVNELLQSTDRPDTANRAKNVLRKVQPFMYHYLSSTTMWGLKASKDFSRIYFAMRPKPSKAYDFKTENYMVKELFMLASGYSDYRGFFLGNQ